MHFFFSAGLPVNLFDAELAIISHSKLYPTAISAHRKPCSLPWELAACALTPDCCHSRLWLAQQQPNSLTLEILPLKLHPKAGGDSVFSP